MLTAEWLPESKWTFPYVPSYPSFPVSVSHHMYGVRSRAHRLRPANCLLSARLYRYVWFLYPKDSYYYSQPEHKVHDSLFLLMEKKLH